MTPPTDGSSLPQCLRNVLWEHFLQQGGVSRSSLLASTNLDGALEVGGASVQLVKAGAAIGFRADALLQAKLLSSKADIKQSCCQAKLLSAGVSGTCTTSPS